MGNVKGKVAEREVAALCQEWWSVLEPSATFVRTPMSGGWHNADVKEEFMASGDIMTTAKRWPFDVEVKRRENWTPSSVIQGYGSPLWDWWLQTQRSAAVSKRQPMLWARRNRSPWLIMIGQAYAAERGLDTLIEPYSRWPESALKAVNYGVHPIWYTAEAFLKLPPRTFLV